MLLVAAYLNDKRLAVPRLIGSRIKGSIQEVLRFSRHFSARPARFRLLSAGSTTLLTGFSDWERATAIALRSSLDQLCASFAAIWAARRHDRFHDILTPHCLQMSAVVRNVIHLLRTSLTMLARLDAAVKWKGGTAWKKGR